MSSNDPNDRTQEGPQKQQPERTLPAIGPDPGGATLPAAPRPAAPPRSSASGPSAPAPAPSGPAAPPQDPLFGKELGGCRIEGLLGRGAMGAVYRARQLRLDREVAVKVIRPELLTDARILKRFEVEARTVGRFNSPHVVMVHDVGFEHGVHFLVMEFVKGKNLRDHTKLLAGGRMQVAEALPMLRQACKGLEEAQRLGVLHRDIKPDNLMITDRGVLKIADFGIAKPAQDDFSMTMTSELIGTPLYMSPEQCQASPELDFRSDMYSLGATFYYLLTGEPPIRASSVYELIQTKTKLEHLCLWKALPELDENHPLSRVIERMTALDRDDRYESYEALVADLSLVEQGRTMDIQRPRSKQTSKPEVVAPRRGSGWAIGAAALVLLAGGGAYAWTQFGPEIEASPKSPGTPPQTASAQRLDQLASQLAEVGPTEALRSELSSLTVAAEQQDQLAALRRDVEQGMAIRARLQAVQPPAALELPFTDLKEHMAAVDTAAAIEGKVGPELQKWVTSAAAAARAEQELGARATAKVVGAFATWQSDQKNAGGDVVQIAALNERLLAIEAGRKQLVELLPALRDSLQKDLPLAALGDAHRDIAKPDTKAVDLSKVLAEIRADFEAQGPVASIENRVAGLQPSDPEQERLRRALLDEMQSAATALQLARAVRSSFPLHPQVPFDDVATYFAAIEREVAPLAKAESGLPKWADAVRTELRDETTLQAAVLDACKQSWADWQQRRVSPTATVADLTNLDTELGKLRTGIAKAQELFPAAAEQFASIVTAEQMGSAKSGITAAVAHTQWMDQVRLIVQRLESVRSLAEWRAGGPQMGKDLQAQTASAAQFAGAADVAAELQRAKNLADRWSEADARTAAVAKALAAGNLPAANVAQRSAPAGTEGREEFQAFATATTRVMDAFTGLDRELDTARAVSLLGEATAALKVHGGLERGAVEHIDRWARDVRELQSAATGMVAIPAGSGLANEPAQAFFMASTEATQSDYLRFLDALQELVTAAGTDAAAQEQAVQNRLGAFAPSADLLRRMLDRRSKLRAPEMPMEGVCWFEAAACAEWFHLALPTKAEWALAAFGDGKSHAFPWGNEWKDDDAARNIGSAAVAAAVGGLSWRSGGSVALHHLAGNVAEWLAADPKGSEGLLAGGRYNDSRKEARQRAAGEDFHKASLTRDLPGFGFRMILRPRQFLAKDFVNGQFPEMGR